MGVRPRDPARTRQELLRELLSDCDSDSRPHQAACPRSFLSQNLLKRQNREANEPA